MMDNASQFFKIILDEGKIWMPKKFVKKHGNGLSSPVTLQVPSGETWQIELSKCDGEVWLGKGWREFAEYYSVDRGSFLVFRYEGHCRFFVIIFDKSTSEIEYPCRSDPFLGQKDDGDENEDAISIETLDGLSPKRNIGENSPLPSHQSCKIMRSDSTNNTSNVESSHCSKRKSGGKHKQMKCKKNAGQNVTRRRSRWNDSQAHEAANKFVTRHPSFTSVVWLTTLKATAVSIPKSFSDKYFEVDSMIVKLKVADRLWHVKVIRYSTWKNTANFCAGWTAFSKDNSLEVGDVCFFELVKSDLLNVSIVRCHQ